MLLIIGQGFSGERLARMARGAGLDVLGVRRSGGAGCVAFDDPALPATVATADFLLSSVPPGEDGDPVLARFGGVLAARRGWTGYLSSTGVYGDTGGAFVDETAPVGGGRRTARTAADGAWQALGAAVLRLPGIYGPGRSALDAVRNGTARRIDRPGHRFSRVHVDDIAGAALALMQGGFRGVWNVVDVLPAEPRAVTEQACGLLGAPLPPLLAPEAAGLSAMARGFWAERRLVSGAKLRRVAGYRLMHPDYKTGLQAIRAEEQA